MSTLSDAVTWSFPKWKQEAKSEAARLNFRDPTDKELASWYEQKLPVREAVGKLETSRKDADGPVKVREASSEKGFKIPAPKDPKEKAEWEAGVAKRKAAGLGTMVGDSRADKIARLDSMCQGLSAKVDAATGEDFRQAKTRASELDAEVHRLGSIMRDFPRGPMGLTPDEVKNSSEYRAAKTAYDKAFQALKDYNQVYVKKYAAQLREDRRR